MTDLRDDRDGWSTANCSIARTLDIVGTRSAMLIMREAFFGTRRFDDFARRVGIGEPAAAARLQGTHRGRPARANAVSGPRAAHPS